MVFRAVPASMPYRRFLQPSLHLRQAPLAVRLLAAAALVMVSFAVRYWLFRDTPGLPFLLFFPAIILSAVYLGRGSGLLATVLSALLALYFFVAPTHSFAVVDSNSEVSLFLFVAVGVFISLIVGTLRKAYVEVEQAHREIDDARQRAEEAHHEAEELRHRAEEGERERDLLLQEFRHRLKNDLARILATIDLQAKRASPDVAEAVHAVGDRLRVLARVHDRLSHTGGHATVDMHDFLHDLVADLRVSIAALTPVGLFIEAEHHPLSVARAGAVGLIANELVTNALKHAFPDERAGAIHVGFRHNGPDYLLTVADDGAGAPVESPENTAGLGRGGIGQRLVRALAAQLGGRVETTAGESGGTTHTLRIPVDAPGDPIGEGDD
ncbi:MAG: DUF4118 domain-containing protein [Rhodospirillales bacterium]|nr:DUF4118 domain-containing protein [Acetobacter sp.]